MRDRERAALQRLTRFGGEQLALDLAAIYLDEMPRRLAVARAALRGRDRAMLADAAHAMKSSSAQLGALDLAAACEATEEAAERGDVPGAAACLADVEARFSSFRAWLAGQTGARDGPVEASAVDERSGAPGRTSTIAVVEDNVDNRLLVDAILGDRFLLQEYATGADALAAMRLSRPDLVLLDVSLPGMDGLEVLARLRADEWLRTVPVVALTAHAMAGDRERYLSAGFDAYVPKPLADERVLIDTVERLLRSRSPGSAA
jgi:CheY-like chemotaxis protein/HPt (histidine-containing phosphotransfer) domain-containing protein